MKKAICFLLALLVLGTSLGAAMAQEETEDTAAETEAMMYPFGATVRFLQLRKPVMRNTLHAQRVIEVLSETANETVIEELQSILDELEQVKEEIAAIHTENGNTDELVEKFVDLKSDAKELTMQFREIASAELSQEQKEQLRTEFSEERLELKELKETITNKIRQFNAGRVKEHFETMGISNETFIEHIENGKVGRAHIMGGVRNFVGRLPPANKSKAFSNVMQQVTKARVQRDAKIERARERFDQRQTQRLQKRMENIEKINNTRTSVMEKIRARITNRVGGTS